MIIDMPNTTSGKIESKLVDLKQNGNAVALGRVLTLVILADETNPVLDPHDQHTDAETAIRAANDASREHPSRVLVLTGQQGNKPNLDAQIRIGGDAGASEVVVLKLTGPLRAQTEPVITPLLVPDTPIVAWWPRHAPQAPSSDPVGKIAALRITDSAHCRDGAAVLLRLAQNYRPGDTDLSWARLTGWRAQIAAALDLPPFEPVTAVSVAGQSSHTSLLLLAGWLAVELGCPTVVEDVPGGIGVTKVVLHRAATPTGNVSQSATGPLPAQSGDIVFDRADGHTLTISQPGYPLRRVALPIATLSEALIEELRRLDADKVYEKVLTVGLGKVAFT